MGKPKFTYEILLSKMAMKAGKNIHPNLLDSFIEEIREHTRAEQLVLIRYLAFYTGFSPQKLHNLVDVADTIESRKRKIDAELTKELLEEKKEEIKEEITEEKKDKEVDLE